MSKEITRQFINQCEKKHLENLNKEKIDQKFIETTIRNYKRAIKFPKGRLKRPVMIGMVGLTGSGKSSIAEQLAKRLKAVVLNQDAFRAKYLRPKSKEYHVYTKPVMECMIRWIIGEGMNIISDGDSVTQEKRNWLEKIAKDLRTRVYYIRVFVDRDIMIERLINARYKPQEDLLRDNVTAVREMWRRTPLHYDWCEKPWPHFKLKKLPIKFLTEIDTTRAKIWKKEVARLVKRLKK